MIEFGLVADTTKPASIFHEKFRKYLIHRSLRRDASSRLAIGLLLDRGSRPSSGSPTGPKEVADIFGKIALRRHVGVVDLVEIN